MQNFKFFFEKQPKSKGTCPVCKSVGEFRYYEDRSGNRLPEIFGKCENKNRCKHHIIPTKNDLPIQSSSSPQIVRDEPTIFVLPKGSVLNEILKHLESQESHLHNFLFKKGITVEHLRQHGLGNNLKSGKTVYVLRNEKGEIANAKYISYLDSGHRDKNSKTFSLKQPLGGEKYLIPLYGADLLSNEKSKLVVVVESEKTKIVAAFYYPEYDWVSCSSADGLTAQKLKVLVGREIIWLCDADDAGRKNSSIRNLEKGGFKYRVVDLFPNKSNGYDIADALLGGEKPDLKGIFSQKENEPNTFYSLKTSTVKYENAPISISVRTRTNWEVVAENFHLFIKFFTEDNAENKSWILEITNDEGENQYIEVCHEDFCSSRKLRNILAAKQISFKAQDSHWTEIQSALFSTNFGRVKKVNRYGYDPCSQSYLFSNKVLTSEMQLVEPNEWRIIESGGGAFVMPTSNRLTEKRLFLTDYEIDFNQWFLLYEKAHLRSNSFIPACFYIFSLFRDIAVSHNDFSSILYLKGAAGSGKSSIVRQLTCLFGYQQSDINLKSSNTDKALIRLMGQLTNSLIWFDEFHNGFTHEGLLQAAYDNSGYHRSSENGKSSHDTETIDITSALALTSNYIPKNPVFFSRCILVQVEDTDKSDEQRIAYEGIRELQKNGLGMITVGLLKHRQLINDNYLIYNKRITYKLKATMPLDGVPERMFSNMAQILTPAAILQSLGSIQMSESTSENDVIEEFAEIGRELIMKQFAIQSSTSILSEFFDILQALYDQRQIQEGVSFRLDNGFLLLRLPSIYPIFQQRYRVIHNRVAPDRDTILQEVFKIERERNEKEIRKTIRFVNGNTISENSLKDSVSNSISITYQLYVDKFGIDFTNRIE